MRCRLRQSAASACVLTCVLAHAPLAEAQPERYPTRPIRVVVPFPAGGNTDVTLRVLGPKLSEALGRQLVIENRGGANTVIGTEIVAKSPPDGYTLLMVTSAISINPSMYKKLPYDTLRDLIPISVGYTQK